MRKIERAQAVEIANREIAEMGPEHDFVIRPDATEERDFGWVFFYAPRRYLETGDKKYLTPGNGPLLVLADGTVEYLTTSMAPAAAIDAYEASWIEANRR